MIGYLILSVGNGIETKKRDWKAFFEDPIIKKTLRGGSALGSAYSYSKGEYDSLHSDIDGYFIFETDDDDELKSILKVIPVVKSGGSVRVHALVED
jgi:hypothetical protein